MRLTPKEEFNLAAKTVAEGFEAQYPDAKIDSEYTETGYTDLPEAVREAGSWSDFHKEVERRLNNMRS